LKLKDAIKIAKTELRTIETAAKECVWLYAKHTGKSTAQLLANDDAKIEGAVFEEFLAKRKENIPFEYIVNSADFYGFEFFVDERVLIPRPETELLIDITSKISKEINAKKLLDICTGSGVIACTLKKLHPELAISASDISEKALEVAKFNAQRLDCDIKFYKSDIFSSINDDSFDILTANPPYIQNGYNLEQNVLYEPHNALFGGDKGYELVIDIINGFFERGFKAMICEFGFDQKEPIDAVLRQKGGIKYEFYTDYSGFDRGFWIIKDDA
jgi:release factor glutamine methyltransferase